MRDKMLGVLNWLRLIDENGLLSLTNVAAIVVIVKLATAREIDFAAAGALLTVMGAYGFKRWHVSGHGKGKIDGDKVQELREKIDRVALAVGLRKG